MSPISTQMLFARSIPFRVDGSRSGIRSPLLMGPPSFIQSRLQARITLCETPTLRVLDISEYGAGAHEDFERPNQKQGGIFKHKLEFFPLTSTLPDAPYRTGFRWMRNERGWGGESRLTTSPYSSTRSNGSHIAPDIPTPGTIDSNQIHPMLHNIPNGLHCSFGGYWTATNTVIQNHSPHRPHAVSTTSECTHQLPMVALYQPSEAEIDSYGSLLIKSDFGGMVLQGALLSFQVCMVIYGLSTLFGTPKDIRKGSTLKDWEPNKLSITLGEAMVAITIAIGDILMTGSGFSLCRVLCALAQPIAPESFDWPVKSSTISTNILVASLILFKLIRTKMVTSKAFPNRKAPRMYADAMGVIVEAAAPLAFFGFCLIVVLGVHFVSPPEKLLDEGKADHGDKCLLSALLWILCQSWKSAVESKEGQGMFSQPIHFVHRRNDGYGSEPSSAGSTDIFLFAS
ncbi:hypothetical protein BKA70DRAFT_1411426 [Coprinopsis sp. MPI-PUGE-AT-0042]|nr:hypothetical protein BKA70DRAFT_1411426 [Coprinopsis sp. MPI-PUGE-AT-0042]